MRVLFLPCALAWGPIGHQIVGRVAQELSSGGAAKAGAYVGSLESVATWADVVKGSAAYKWSAGLHFIDIPDKVCTFQYDRDCKADECVAGAILNFTARLSLEDGAQVAEALKFLVHFIGDIHQPLHCGWSSDRGGNGIHVVEDFLHDRKGNLHAVWDTALLARLEADKHFTTDQLGDALEADAKGNMTKYTACVVAATSVAGASPSLKDCVTAWAEEGIADACKYAYVDENGKPITNQDDLDEGYYQRNALVVEERLAAGAARLSAVLDKFFPAAPPAPPSPGPPPPSPTPGATCAKVGCHFFKHGQCGCNAACSQHGDCCPDYSNVCNEVYV